MISFKQLQCEYEANGELHHAYMVAGKASELLPEILSFCENVLNVSIRRNPDFFNRLYETFGIDDSRHLKERASKKTLDGARQVFILSVFSMTHEAQNALLKLFEEPCERTHFFLIVPSESLLLPTLRSRCNILRIKRHHEVSEDAQQFLKATGAKRTILIESLIKEKNKARAHTFCDDIEVILREEARDRAAWRTFRPALESVEKCRGYLTNRSPSVKMILEYLVATLPRIT